jgi:hypothetical protein
MGYKYIKGQEKYKQLIETVNKNPSSYPQYISDVAYNELMQALDSDQFVDEYGFFKYKEYNEFLNGFKNKWGNQVWTDIEQRRSANKVNYPALYHEYQKSKDVLGKYWEALNAVRARYGEDPKGTMLKRMNKELERVRTEFKKNPQVVYYINLFYNPNYKPIQQVAPNRNITTMA